MPFADISSDSFLQMSRVVINIFNLGNNNNNEIIQMSNIQQSNLSKEENSIKDKERRNTLQMPF